MPRVGRAWLAALVLVAASCNRPAPIEARPALWRVADGDTTIWLLGTIHALPPGVRWETPPVAAAIRMADTLVTEIPAGATGGIITEPAARPPIADRLPPNRKAALERASAIAGVTLDELSEMDSWRATVTIGEGQVRAAGASRTNGIEAVLARRFAGRRQLAFETLSGQLALFSRLPESAQRVLLRRAVDRPEDYRRTLDAWVTGDVVRLQATLTPGFAAAPALEDMLVTQRNARWSRWIAARLMRPGRVLVAVGAGHLVGPRSVIAMLRARGLPVVRVE